MQEKTKIFDRKHLEKKKKAAFYLSKPVSVESLKTTKRKKTKNDANLFGVSHRNWKNKAINNHNSQ